MMGSYKGRILKRSILKLCWLFLNFTSDLSFRWHQTIFKNIHATIHRKIKTLSFYLPLDLFLSLPFGLFLYFAANLNLTGKVINTFAGTPL